MNRIDTIHIHNFKFFQEQEPIHLGGNNLLLYGENGSGKSSIYWSLYTLFESSLKTEDDQIKKYFSKIIKKEDSLLNIHAKEKILGSDDYNSFIKVVTNDTAKVTYNISINDTAIRGNTNAKYVNYASDFINYRMLQSFSAFRHSDKIDLFDMFVEDIFKYVQFARTKITRNGTSLHFTNAFDIWKQIEIGHEWVDSVRSKTPRRIRAYKGSVEWDEFESLVNSFNESLQKLLDYINIHGPAYFKKLGYEFSYHLSMEKAGYKKGDKDFSVIPFKIAINIPQYDGLSSPIDKPHSFLNEAKLSALAISIRFAILSQKLKEECLKFIVLDDLLISLDMRNREKVLDLLLSKEFSENYQLIILTHDRMFYQIAKNTIKYFGQENWVYYEMFEDVVDGTKKPAFQVEDTYIEKARNQFYIIKDYESAGNYMRKQAEDFCKDFLPKRLHFERKTFVELNLSNKLRACMNFAKDNGLDDSPFKKLDNHRKFIFNALSHSSYDVPMFKNEIELSFQTFIDLEKIKYKTVFLPETKLHFELNDGSANWRCEIILYDELKLIKENNKSSILTAGMINYYIYKTTSSKPENPQHKHQSIKSMYDNLYTKSNKMLNNDFWEEVIISETNQKLKEIRVF